MEEHPECTLCTHAVKQVKPDKTPKGVVRPYNTNTICPIKDVILGGGYFFGTTSLLYPKKLMNNPPGFYINASAGDYPLQILLTYKGYTYYFDEIMAAYRVGVKGSWSQRHNLSKDAKFKQIAHADKVINMLDEFNTYSNYMYSNIVNKKILQFEFNKLINQNNIMEIRSENIKNIMKS